MQKLVLVIEQDDAKLLMFQQGHFMHHAPPYIIRRAKLSATLVTPADNVTGLIQDAGFTQGKRRHVQNSRSMK
ncbi:hypothetical protein EMIT091MI3_10517 [Kosakonia quasisacchari]